MFQISFALALLSPFFITVATVFYLTYNYCPKLLCRCLKDKELIKVEQIAARELVPVELREKRPVKISLKEMMDDHWYIKDFDYEYIFFEEQ